MTYPSFIFNTCVIDTARRERELSTVHVQTYKFNIFVLCTRASYNNKLVQVELITVTVHFTTDDSKTIKNCPRPPASTNVFYFFFFFFFILVLSAALL